jgi:uncharacterized membrane protein
VNRLLKPVIVLLAVIYFIVDAVFLRVAKPLADWLFEHRIFDGLREWIVSLRPYPTLALFAVPVLVLEPVKPAAAYLAATGHVASGAAVFVVGEVLKLVLVERLFVLGQKKLMSIPAFAWAYRQYRQVMDWFAATEIWQAVRRWSRVALYSVRIYLLELKASHRTVRMPFQHR